MKNVIVFGGDGFCGWPTALHLSELGYDVTIVDNMSRREIDIELDVDSLTPIRSMRERLRAWKEVSGKTIAFENLTLGQDYEKTVELINRLKPQAVVHFAEQRAAPYSMKSASHKRYTVNNNLNGTHDLLCAIVESGLDVHIVHLGTMGVYGYGTAGATIPEGYLTVHLGQATGFKAFDILYPANPGSIYHMTKTQDQLFFQYYAKNDRLRITDLHQGIVWGTQTPETIRDERLINRFDYDGDYGTVLNRFLMQAAIGYRIEIPVRCEIVIAADQRVMQGSVAADHFAASGIELPRISCGIDEGVQRPQSLSQDTSCDPARPCDRAEQQMLGRQPAGNQGELDCELEQRASRSEKHLARRRSRIPHRSGLLRRLLPDEP